MTASLHLAGDVALVTGASKGIGRGAALALARAGADVAVNYYRDADGAAAVVRAVEGLGRRAVAIQADVADREAVQRLVAEAEGALGPIDLLVANAVFSVREPFLEADYAHVRRAMAVSAFGAFHTCQLAVREMVARGAGGRVVVIGSPHAVHPFPGAVDYNMAKAAVVHMAGTLAAEMCRHRINVNVVEPGWTDTPGERTWASDQELAAVGPQLPWGRLGTPEDIGHAVVYLCSREAEYVTGATLRVDGGLFVNLTMDYDPRREA